MNKIILIASLFVLSSCSISHRVAPIEYHHGKNQDSNTDSKILVKADNAHTNKIEHVAESDVDVILPQKVEINQNIYQNNSKSEAKIIYHEVKAGETIDDLAITYQQDVEEIAALNGLIRPYNISEFQIVKIYDKKISTNSVTSPKIQSDSSFLKPVKKGKIISKFKEKTELGNNKGINIAAQEGEEIIAVTSGKVIYSSYDAVYGNLVIIQSKQDNLFITYAHMKGTELAVGDHVYQGEVIGYVGSSGKVSKSQLHFSIRKGKTSVDPLSYVKY